MGEGESRKQKVESGNFWNHEDLFEQEIAEGAEIKREKGSRGFSSQFSASSASSCSKSLQRDGVAQRFAIKLMRRDG